MLRLSTPQQATDWLRDRVTGTLWADSRKIGSGDGFIAWPGAATDARHYVGDALNAGAQACIVEHDGVENYGFSDSRIASFAGLRAAAAPIASAYFQEPSKQLSLVAVTGTNGKTTTAWWLAQALATHGRKCGLVGTLGIGVPESMVFNGLTTPDPVLLQQQLRRFVDEGFAACAVEASSIGIAEQRLDATQVQVGIFTNFTQDHLDYHDTLQAYWSAKESLFNWAGLKSAVLNIDDLKGLALSSRLISAGLDSWTFSVTKPARLEAQNIELAAQPMGFDVVEAHERHRVTAPTVGLYNVSNLLGVIGAMRALGISLEDAVRACKGLTSVPGRLDTLSTNGQPLVVIDYAHTPDALDKVLAALLPVAQGRAGKLWCIFGCGGARDATKRPLMAAIVQKYADQIVVTSDNPRNESAVSIIEQILTGLVQADSVHVQADRALAISQTIALAQPGDVVLLAGKGHESYQEINGVQHPFSDRVQALKALQIRVAGEAVP